MDQVTVRKWGNSQGIRLPKKITGQLGIKATDVLDIYTENDTIIIRKSFKHKSFEERLAEYNGQISACEFDWGEPIGRELL